MFQNIGFTELLLIAVVLCPIRTEETAGNRPDAW